MEENTNVANLVKEFDEFLDIVSSMSENDDSKELCELIKTAFKSFIDSRSLLNILKTIKK